MNICKNCQHFECRVDGLRTGVWYNQFCKAVTRPQDQNPQSGEMQYVQVNTFGQRYFTDEPYPYARDMNPSGECELFVEREKGLLSKIM